MIGYAMYQCSCVHYVTPVNIELIVGLILGSGVLLIVVIAIISIVIRRRIRHSKMPEEEEQEQINMSTEQNINYAAHYSRELDDDYPYEDYIPSSPRFNPRMPSGLDLLQTEREHSWPTLCLNRNTLITESTT